MTSRSRTSGKLIAKIQSRAAQISRAVAIDEELYAIALNNRITLLFFIERHLVV